MLFAVVIGALALRTEGFQFIMVTLAFAQMVYYIGAESWRTYGGDNGFEHAAAQHAGPGSALANHTTFYYVVLALLLLVLLLTQRLVKSEFGTVIRGRRDNERRLAAIGFPPFLYKYAVFLIAAGIAGLAGALMANHARFVSPAIMSWQVSGELLSMVILGSAGTSLIGPMFGAAVYPRLPAGAVGLHRPLDDLFRPPPRRPRAARPRGRLGHADACDRRKSKAHDTPKPPHRAQAGCRQPVQRERERRDAREQCKVW